MDFLFNLFLWIFLFIYITIPVSNLFSIIPDCVNMYIVVLALRDFSFSLVKLKHNLS